MRRICRLSVALVLGGLLHLAPPLHAQDAGPARITLVAEDGTERTLGLAELRTLPAQQVAAVMPDSQRIIFRGPAIRALLTLAGAPEGHDLRGPAMHLIVIAEAADGYKVVYSLAELDPEYGHRAAIVALTEDGHPLSSSDGPFRIVLAGDQHLSRWIRQLTTLRIVRAIP